MFNKKNQSIVILTENEHRGRGDSVQFSYSQWMYISLDYKVSPFITIGAAEVKNKHFSGVLFKRRNISMVNISPHTSIITIPAA